MITLTAIGNLGGDPELRYTESGRAVASFRLASNRNYSTSVGEKRQETEWITVICWSGLAETVNNYLSKGDRIYVSGRLQTKTWTGQDGKERYNVECVAQQVEFLTTKGGANAPEPDEERDTPW